MRIAFLPIAGLLALSSCNSMQQDNLSLCEQALFGAGISSPAKLFSVALATPACIALGAEAISALISKVSVQQKARGIRE
jgi:hypothetical protein